jgi:hypothetical protein
MISMVPIDNRFYQRTRKGTRNPVAVVLCDFVDQLIMNFHPNLKKKARGVSS